MHHPDPSHVRAVSEGCGLQQPAQLEAHLESAPDDLEAHLRLLGHYGGARLEDAAARPDYMRHVLWLIRHHPRLAISASPDAGVHPTIDGHDAWAAAAAAWEDQLAEAPDDAAVVLGAAKFYTPHDRARAEALLRHGAELLPDQSVWLERLAHLDELGLGRRDPAERPDVARRALKRLERAMALDPRSPRSPWLWARAADMAFEAGEHARARELATALLEWAESQGPRGGGDAIHDGHFVLGRLALDAGDLAGAREHLLASARTPGSPVLGSFGPRMRLARELLERGESEAALAYLELCKAFWGSHEAEIDAWEAAIRRGDAPDFKRFRQ